MLNYKKNPSVLIGLVCLGILSLDQFSKFLVYKLLTAGQSIPLIPGILNLTFVRNTGAAFGILRNFTFIFIFAAIFIIIYIGYLIFTKQHLKVNPYMLGIFLGGSIGNLIDRLRFGYVVDFIDIHIWPVFNIADSAITISVCWFLILMLKNKNASNSV